MSSSSGESTHEEPADDGGGCAIDSAERALACTPDDPPATRTFAELSAMPHLDARGGSARADLEASVLADTHALRCAAAGEVRETLRYREARLHYESERLAEAYILFSAVFYGADTDPDIRMFAADLALDCADRLLQLGRRGCVDVMRTLVRDAVGWVCPAGDLHDDERCERYQSLTTLLAE